MGIMTKGVWKIKLVPTVRCRWQRERRRQPAAQLALTVYYTGDPAAEVDVTPALGKVRHQTRDIRDESECQDQELRWQGPRLATATVK